MDANHVQKYKNLSNVILEEIDVNRLGVPHAGEDTINYYINDNIIDYVFKSLIYLKKFMYLKLAFTT